MTETGAEFAARYATGRATLDAAGIDTVEHDACGVGLVAALDGKPRRRVVQAGIDALKAVWHRGAVDADGKTTVATEQVHHKPGALSRIVLPVK